jgi:hypothetical protein
VLKTKRKLSSTNTHEQVKEKERGKENDCNARGKSDDIRMTDKQRKWKYTRLSIHLSSYQWANERNKRRKKNR